jgi:hypothetical protein
LQNSFLAFESLFCGGISADVAQVVWAKPKHDKPGNEQGLRWRGQQPVFRSLFRGPASDEAQAA